MDPKGRVALIAGGARIGRTVAEWLARRGCDVAMTYHASREAVEETVAKVKQLGVRALAIEADLAVPGGPPAAVAATRDGLGRIDILVTMASVYGRTAFDDLDEKAWRRSIEADLASVYRLAVAAAPHMRAQ